MNPSQPSSLSGLLLPLADRTLLLPNVAVAEVIRYQDNPRQPDNGQKADWLLGLIDWRGLALPLISFEALSGAAAPESGPRLAVINASHEKARLKFFAVLLQAFPRPLRLSAQLARSEEPLQALELAAVQLENGNAKIPDLDALEEKLLAAGWL